MRFQLSYRASDKHVVVQTYGETAVAGHTVIGNFYHNGGGTDVEGTNVGSHTLWHDIRDILYSAAGEQNMQAVTIVYNYLTGITLVVADAAMNTSSDTTEQATITYTPTAASNRTVTYVSSDPTKATVSATGLITAVAAGTTVITATSEEGGFTSSVTVTVS
jgi:hypothetical protein